jgi:hypothetical protein
MTRLAWGFKGARALHSALRSGLLATRRPRANAMTSIRGSSMIEQPRVLADEMHG